MNAATVEQRFAAAMQQADRGEPAAAEAELLTLAAAYPALLPLRHALVRVRLLKGNADAALAAAAHPPLFDDRRLFAAVVGEFGAAGAHAQRAELLRRAARHAPHDVELAVALAAAAHGLYRPCEAIRCSEHALALRPQARVPREIRAAALVDRGDVEAGLAAWRELGVESDPDSSARYLVLAHYDPVQDGDSLHAAIARHAQRHLPQADVLPVKTQRAARRRIGWVSPRFASGPVATFLHGLLAQFDRERHEHVLVALQPVRDEAGHALLHLADEAVDASGLDDRTLLQRLRALRLDVLVDLAGHATANRMPVLARRVAPLQVCWLDWFDTTGVAAIDAWISDPWLTPEDSGQHYSERLVRLASGRFCYSPSASAPPPTRHGGEDAPVFASFNRLAKLNDRVLDAWATILHAVPSARLALRARHLGEAETRAHVAARFAARGIGAERLDLGEHLAYDELLEAYRSVDIALDPFPFSGCTTTCDALWMGCAVVALAGRTFVSRQAASLLWRLGRADWVAHDAGAYVECAVALAAQVAVLRDNRVAQREGARRQLCDAGAQARDFERVLDDLSNPGSAS